MIIDSKAMVDEAIRLGVSKQLLLDIVIKSLLSKQEKSREYLDQN